MADKDESFMLYDNKERAFISNKEYASRKTANRAADRKNQEYGAHRYSPERYSDIINRQIPKSGGGSGGAASDTREMQLGAELDPKAMMQRSGMKKGGVVKSASNRADGIAQRGKTKGRMV